ncbi:MAG: Hint domain-containing protein [Rhodobacteraceae bacterium]|nr:Hint domain-containing protein [Paracoccaceae bacterium]
MIGKKLFKALGASGDGDDVVYARAKVLKAADTKEADAWTDAVKEGIVADGTKDRTIGADKEKGHKGHGSGGSGKGGSGKAGSGSEKGGSGSGGSGSGGSGSGGSGSGSGTGGSGGGSHVPCFVAGTMIETACGPVPVELIRPGDKVQTRDNGLQPVLWAGGQSFRARQLAISPALAPVRIAAGSFGATADLLVSPQHRLLLRGPEVQLYFGPDEVFAPAIALLTGGSLVQIQPKGDIGYHHLLLENHQVLNAQGCWSESLFPGDMALSALTAPSRIAIADILGPELAQMRTARPCLRPFEARLLADIARDSTRLARPGRALAA